MKVQYIDQHKVDNRYRLCVLVAKRANELSEFLHAQSKMRRTKIIGPLVNTESLDPLEIAFEEVKEGKVALKEE